MSKHIRALSLLLVAVFILSGCNQPIEIVNYLEEVKFSGLNTAGEMRTPELNHSEIRQHLQRQKETSKLLDEITVSVDKKTGLSNGETVTVTVEVPESMQHIAVGGSKTYTVTGLEQPIVLTNDEIAANLVINFVGASGRGRAQIDSTFSDAFLQTIKFGVENDGFLTNGDEVRIKVDEATRRDLSRHRYVLDPHFNVTVDVNGLKEVATKSSDIVNFVDIERMIQEEVLRRFQNQWGYTYEVASYGFMYRQYAHEGGLGNVYNSQTNHGSLIGVFTVKQYADSNPDKLYSEKTVILGYSDIFLDELGHANVAEISLIADEKDSTYSLASVFKLYEGYGYEKVND
ncbi:hypothetical protein NHG34_06495 [Aerococcaceae bacterium NML190938]|nr:hypothetical protein [Aerococcaceae bacterium NML191219]MCW6667201.1 hypothetical protein [Aerococcaceae bacterium NML190938]